MKKSSSYKVIKLLFCSTLIAIIGIVYFKDTGINPKWKENLLIGLTVEETIQFMGIPDERDLLKGYMTWFDHQSNKTLSISFGPKLPENYDEMNEEKRLWFYADYEKHILIAYHIYVKDTSLETQYLIRNREERLLIFLKEKRKCYSYID